MKRYKNIGILLLILIYFSILVSCASKEVSTPLKISIIHINDHHSHIEPQSFDLDLGGAETRVSMGGFPQLVTVIKEQQSIKTNPIVLHAGDALSGTVYYALFKGKSDAELMNRIKWDAFVLGNHEFDDGNDTLKSFLDILDAPTVAANVVPDKGSALEGAWEPYRIKEVEGQRIGIIGIDIVGKTVNSSNPGEDIKFFDEIATTKKYVNMLQKKGINKIIVLTHIGHKNAINLATSVAGIDVIVTGDSHTLLSSEKMIPELFEEGKYPTIVDSPKNEPVAIVQAWEYSKAVGVLDVEFDAQGVITSASGHPIIILSDTFRRKNSEGKRVEVENPDREAIYRDIASLAYLDVVEPNAQAIEILERYKAEKEKVARVVVGQVAENIPGGSNVRVPVLSDENPEAKWGHFTAQLVADGMLYKLKNLGTGHIDAVIQNAGGVRIPLFQGDINAEIVYTLLPFGNTIVTMELTGEEIKTALEQSIDYALSPDGSTGAFPYPSGMRYDVDLSKGLNSRVSNIEIQQDDTWMTIDPQKSYIIGANNYIAGGKDGYIIFGEIEESKKIDTYIDDAQCFMDYVRAMKTISKPERTNVTLLGQ